ncbi:hypothetical protein [Tardiphaga sp.]|jgi:hypothetical protein|uniref:hypothetical protein n=1 Tax=Tardiphaga sp. TaxID=1926292 RepID=UPI0037D99961
MIHSHDDRQLELLLDECGENAEHIKQLQKEAKEGYPAPFVPYQKPKPIDPWPPHMRFD